MTRVYEYDVFISYQRRGLDVPAWVRTHFYPRLSEVLDNNVDRDVKIFFDELLTGGTEWPTQVRTALRRSRILVPVCSPKYFLDEWCLAEWHSMARREKITGTGLIYPVIFCDSHTFPKYAKDRQMRNFRDWNLPQPQFQDTIAYLDFHHEVERIAEELAVLIESVPPWQPDWPVGTWAPGPPPGPPTLPRL